MKDNIVHLLTFVLFLLGIYLIVWVGEGASQLTINDPIFIKTRNFATSYNKWADYLNENERLNSISPYSLEYKHEVEKKWKKLNLSKKFRRLEREVQGE